MAPTRGKPSSSKGSKSGSSKGSKSGSSKGSKSKGSKPSSNSSAFKVKKPSKPAVSRPAVQQKTKSAPRPVKKKKRIYTDKELGITKLNKITPVGVHKAERGKKGKVFVDDQESMMTILAMVNADKEGQIESKMMKARQMEEIRQARQREMDARQESKNAKFEETKNSLRRKRGRTGDAQDVSKSEAVNKTASLPNVPKKRVSFG